MRWTPLVTYPLRVRPTMSSWTSILLAKGLCRMSMEIYSFLPLPRWTWALMLSSNFTIRPLGLIYPDLQNSWIRGCRVKCSVHAAPCTKLCKTASAKTTSYRRNLQARVQQNIWIWINNRYCQAEERFFCLTVALPVGVIVQCIRNHSAAEEFLGLKN